jgi:hypothetical protein
LPVLADQLDRSDLLLRCCFRDLPCLVTGEHDFLGCELSLVLDRRCRFPLRLLQNYGLVRGELLLETGGFRFGLLLLPFLNPLFDLVEAIVRDRLFAVGQNSLAE